MPIEKGLICVVASQVLQVIPNCLRFSEALGAIPPPGRSVFGQCPACLPGYRQVTIH